MLFSTTSSALQPLENPYGVPAALMAGPDVPVEAKAVTQALQVCELAVALGNIGGSLNALLLTPDIHIGPSVPVGLVFDTHGALVPGAIGNDVGCGMRLAVFDNAPEELSETELAQLTSRLRHVFFEGGRDLPLTPQGRLDLLENGLEGLVNDQRFAAGDGNWEVLQAALAGHVSRTHQHGSIAAGGVDDAMAAWANGTGERDSQLGSVGGGNHFVEIQRIREIADGPTAWDWGLQKGKLAVMVHAGSLGFGHLAGGGARRFIHEHPRFGYLPDSLQPLTDPDAQRRYVRAMSNAANLAWANRLALTAMAVGVVADVLGEQPRWLTIGDSPHNLIWPDGDGWRHRKGACPAGGPDGNDAYTGYTGEPVFVPGSLGDSSWVLAGNGCEEVLSSTCHGAGRVLSRGKAARTRDDEADAQLHVVTPMDTQRIAAEGRRDLLAEYDRRVREEAPRAYKPVEPVVDAVVAAGAARKIARLEPVLTVKG